MSFKCTFLTMTVFIALLLKIIKNLYIQRHCLEVEEKLKSMIVPPFISFCVYLILMEWKKPWKRYLQIKMFFFF